MIRSSERVETLHFHIEGSFITDLAREWYFLEKKNYSECEELLLSCMMSGEDSEEVLQMKKQFALDIIEGRKKFVGIDEFTLEDDNSTIRLVHVEEMERRLNQALVENAKLKEENEYLNTTFKITSEMLEIETQKADRLQESFDRINNKLSRIIENNSPIYRLRCYLAKSNFVDMTTLYTEIFVNGNLPNKDKEQLKDLLNKANIHPSRNRWGYDEIIVFYDNDSDKVMSSEELIKRGFAIIEPEKEVKKQTKKPDKKYKKENRVEAKYGWLDPTGRFFESPWGTHEHKARNIIDKNGWIDEYMKWDDAGIEGIRFCRDFLINVKGYVLIDNPNLLFGHTRAVCPEKLTKKQKDFLYKYFMNLGDTLYAETFMKN